MPGPLPKPEEERRRRNAPTVPTTELPVAGYSGPVPDPVEELDELERRYYEWAWTTPAAAAWHVAEAEIVAEWARLKAYATRCLRGEILKTTAQGMQIPAELSSAVYSQIVAREDRLYLSPMARAKGRAKIVEPPAPVRDPDAPADGSNVVSGRFGKITAV